MASSRVCGSRLSAPPSVEYRFTRTRCKGSGERSEIAMERCIDALVWKDLEIQGEVIAKPKKNTRRVKWHIGDQYFETEHAAAFWKKMGESSILTDPVLHTQNQQLETRPTAFDEEESQNHDEPVLGNDADDELNPSEAHSSGASVTTDPYSAHGQQWELLQGAVTECQRSKDGWQFKETRILWSEALADATWRDEEACLNHTMPTEFWNHALQWTNLSLPDDIRPFNLHEH